MPRFRTVLLLLCDNASLTLFLFRRGAQFPLGTEAWSRRRGSQLPICTLYHIDNKVFKCVSAKRLHHSIKDVVQSSSASSKGNSVAGLFIGSILAGWVHPINAKDVASPARVL